MRNGGGAFLIPYCLAMVVIGFPTFFLEVVIGQFSGLSPSMVWNVIPLFKGIGWGMTVAILVVSVLYGHLVTWILYYLAMSFSAELPWTSCNNTWNTENCIIRQLNASFNATIKADVLVNGSDSLNFTDSRVSPGEEFLRNNVLELTDDATDLGGLRWQLVVCHLVGWSTAGLCVIKGIKSVGKVVYVTSIAPYILLTILLIRGCLLPGAVDGIMYFIKPDFSKLLEFRIWIEAAIQIFYSIGAFGGGNIMFASYSKFHNNCQRDTILIVIINCLTSIYGGFAVFAVVGHMAHRTGIPVDKVLKSGPGLAFIVYPEALSKLPLPQLWSVLFFLMLTTLAIGTQIGHFQTVVSCVTDAFPHLRSKRIWILLAHVLFGSMFGLIFCSRGGMYWFQLVDWYGITTGTFVMMILGTLGLSWLYGLNRLYKDTEMMIGKKPFFVFKIFWGVLTPAYTLTIFIYILSGFSRPTYGSYVYPNWAIVIACLIPMASIIQLPAFAVVGIVREKGRLLKRLRVLTSPNKIWGPQASAYYEGHPWTKQDGLKETLPLAAVAENGTFMKPQPFV
ncbi:sodium-dependent proline transporter-like [Lineus longissimus]|uniref:sodium-dependent proline transporter-like n=1 Tax=Lineus longissimus TaxID=88925 RepID=UPI002B4E517B